MYYITCVENNKLQNSGLQNHNLTGAFLQAVPCKAAYTQTVAHNEVAHAREDVCRTFWLSSPLAGAAGCCRYHARENEAARAVPRQAHRDVEKATFGINAHRSKRD